MYISGLNWAFYRPKSLPFPNRDFLGIILIEFAWTFGLRSLLDISVYIIKNLNNFWCPKDQSQYYILSAQVEPHSWIQPHPFSKVLFLGFFLNRTPFFSKKVHFLRDFLNWTSPKNSYWKIEPRGYTRADTNINIFISRNS